MFTGIVDTSRVACGLVNKDKHTVWVTGLLKEYCIRALSERLKMGDTEATAPEEVCSKAALPAAWLTQISVLFGLLIF